MPAAPAEDSSTPHEDTPAVPEDSLAAPEDTPSVPENTPLSETTVPSEVPYLIPQPVPRQRRGLVVTLVAVVVVLTLVGVGLVTVALRLGGATTATGRIGLSASPSPSPTPLSGDAYQALLSQLDAALGPPLQAISGTHERTVVASASIGLRDAIIAQIQLLTAVTAPTPVQAVHEELLVGLGQLRNMVHNLGEADSTVCGGSAAVAMISQSPAAAQIRAVALKLATADPAHAYRVGGFLPAPIPDSNRRLGNGTMVKKIGQRGGGKFTVKNDFDRDAAITLAPVGSSTATFVVYVQAKAHFSVSGIPDGTYGVYLRTGGDWDPASKGFTRDCHQEKFTDTFKFTTTSRTTTVWELSLGVTQGTGNAGADDVDSVPA